MMSDSCLAIETYKFASTDKVILDTNVWYFLFGPGYRSDDKRVDVYSRALHRLRSVGAKPHVDQLILSEFANRYARQEFSYQKDNGIKDFKDYCRSSDFRAVANAIKTYMTKIVATSILVDSRISLIDFRALLEDFVTLNVSFNDLIIAQTCKAGGYTIITHDKDFVDLGIPVITGNKALLN